MSTRTRTLPVLACLVGFAAGCEGAGGSRAADDDGAGDADTDADADSDTDADADSDADECSEESKLIYTVDLDDTLYRFDPPAMEFQLVGDIDCGSGGSPYALSVSRDDLVYVLFTSGASCVAINAVSALDATCLGPTEFDCGNPSFQAFGMGTSTDGPDSIEDTLFIGSENMLGAVDTETWEVTPIGPVQSTPDMSGNANGELFAYFAWTDPPRVSQLDKATAEEFDTIPLPELGSVGAFAFAFWGGDFYLFFDGNSTSTTVYRLHDGELETYLADTGLTIVGADVSTCAPVSVE